MTDTALQGFAHAAPINFSYASPTQRRVTRAVIKVVECFTGQPTLKRLYQGWTSAQPGPENIFAAGTRLLDLKLELDGLPLSKVPATGPLLIIANHPYGVLDGLAIGAIATSVRNDVKIMTHSLLCSPPEAAPYMLPVDFSGTFEARIATAQTRRNAQDWLKQGHCVVIFPSGSVATSQKPWRGKALEPAWHPFTAKLATVPGVHVLPIYFHGQNSRLFQIASHLHYACRLSLLFRETYRRMGTALRATIGDVITPAHTAAQPDRASLIADLRRQTLALGGRAAPDPALEFQWPKHIKFN
jgi:putative hemolysin